MALDDWLAQFVASRGGVAGTVHRREGDVLSLAAALNIPPPVLEKTRTIPRGKGMAGLAWERDDVVATCNLKADQTGNVRPGAKAVNAQGAVAIPVHDAAGGLRAVVGVAFAEDRDFSADELATLRALAEALPADA